MFSAVLAACVMLMLLAAPAQATLQLLKPNPSVPATFRGKGAASTDGLGQNTPGGTVQANVPGGSTVVRAYLYGTYNSANPPPPNQAQRTINFDNTNVELAFLPNSEPGNSELATARAEVTNQVKSKVGGGGGITNFAINNDPSGLDGVALVVIYANNSLPETTIAVLDGGSRQTGDTTTFNFASPINPGAPGFFTTLALGSGFSFQGSAGGHVCGGGQFSTVDVNSQRLTSCAGNFDDGLGADDALITVGGVGDSLSNPANPNSSSTGEDDELYDLKPFMKSGDTQLSIKTENPSQDDNLFLAVVQTSARAAVTTEICTDGQDNDGDGLVDGGDPDCHPEQQPPEQQPEQQPGTPGTGQSAVGNSRPRISVGGVPRRSCVTRSFRMRVHIRDASSRMRRVHVRLDGKLVKSTTRKRFSVRIPARSARSGRHRISVTARDRGSPSLRASRTTRFSRCATVDPFLTG